MVRKLIATLALGGAFALGACNTVQGAGEDISSVGECGEDVLDGDSC
ncbi:entericidin A/B family lipoprotein [Sphingomicrobium sediminis]|uniref:Entericidin A/B family lipoprotein n=1 Tax=Sphingomicrobium sediminis TaxID=2950949 RepID=A0A9X2EKT4_9SPHN|nr:entericidin A/B family lipoprotein [Sphingomicrobium sediminis]MCM8557434.1 entericidin A/B family lipoprotein [Sphingomicrobium sediminis]